MQKGAAMHTQQYSIKNLINLNFFNTVAITFLRRTITIACYTESVKRR